MVAEFVRSSSRCDLCAARGTVYHLGDVRFSHIPGEVEEVCLHCLVDDGNQVCSLILVGESMEGDCE